MLDCDDLIRNRLGFYFSKWAALAFSNETDREAVQEAHDRACETAGFPRRDLMWSDGPYHRPFGFSRTRSGFVSREIIEALVANLGLHGMNAIACVTVWEASEFIRGGLRDMATNGAFDNQDDVLTSILKDEATVNILPMLDLLLSEARSEISTVLIPREIEHVAAVVKAFENCATIERRNDYTIAYSRPVMHRLSARGLHCEDGPALVYANGERVFALDGVVVPPEVVLTPADQWDARAILATSNAEARGVLVRRLGIERVLLASGARVLDSWGDYQLYLLNLKDGHDRPYLRMKNPSTGEWHIEGVHPSCRNVKAALVWRNNLTGRFKAPEAIT